MEIAIIGAGIAGLSCAARLREGGHEVSLLDKGRGPGGRMSTRRMDIETRTLRFDHGAQYFTAREPAFIDQVEAWQEAGLAARWPSGGEEAWVGTPAMNAPVRAMADALGTNFSALVEGVSTDGERWKLAGEGLPDRAFEALVIAVPAEQAAPLLLPHDEGASRLAAATRSDPCWTLMLAFEKRLAISSDTIRDIGAIGWAARNSSKPGRDPDECWVVQATPEWSRSHLEYDAATIATLLRKEFASAIGENLPRVLASSAHRWRYARSGKAGSGHIWNEDINLGVCGDWLIAPRVEAAWMSGKALAEAILGFR